MTLRSAAALLASALLLGVALLTLEIRSDAEGVFGAESARLGFDALGTAEGRRFAMLVSGGTEEARATATAAALALLRADPAISHAAPRRLAPKAETLDWLWRHRFRLAPPGASDLTPEAMADQLTAARRSLTSAEGFAAGDRFLRDPTGSYARLLAALSRPGLRGGGSRALKNATLVVGSFADGPFDAAATNALAERLRALPGPSGPRLALGGQRFVSAAVSAEIERNALVAAGAGFGLLFLWLAWALRSAVSLLFVVAPVVGGLAAGTLAITLAFGAVHVIALGFGAALCGLALDYPMHLMAHPGADRARAQGLIGLGAVTTAIAFASLLGSGIPALAQTGLFVATGLVTAALIAAFLVPPDAIRPRILALDRLFWRLPARRGVLAATAVAAVGALAAVEAGWIGAQRQAFALPAQIAADLEHLRETAGIRDARYLAVIDAPDREALLAKSAAAAAALEALPEPVGHALLGTVLPPEAAQIGAESAWPDADRFAAEAETALAAAGFAPGFLPALTEAFAAARRAPPVTPESLRAEADLAPLVDGLGETAAGYRETARLSGVSDRARTAAALDAAGATLLDTHAAAKAALPTLRNAALPWLGIGALAAFGFLIAWLRARRRRGGGDILLATLAATALTAATQAVLWGPLGIFEVVALALVVGIGIDYGVFLSTDHDVEARRSGARSVALCATSTGVAFAAMVVSADPVLSSIATTVVTGIIAMLALSLATDARAVQVRS